jgi:hypothetical protein
VQLVLKARRASKAQKVTLDHKVRKDSRVRWAHRVSLALIPRSKGRWDRKAHRESRAQQVLTRLSPVRKVRKATQVTPDPWDPKVHRAVKAFRALEASMDLKDRRVTRATKGMLVLKGPWDSRDQWVQSVQKGHRALKVSKGSKDQRVLKVLRALEAQVQAQIYRSAWSSTLPTT